MEGPLLKNSDRTYPTHPAPPIFGSMEPIPAMYMNVLKRLWIFMKKGAPPQLISQYFSIAGYRNTPVIISI